MVCFLGGYKAGVQNILIHCLTTRSHRACGVVVSHPLSMREAQGLIPCMSIFWPSRNVLCMIAPMFFVTLRASTSIASLLIGHVVCSDITPASHAGGSRAQSPACPVDRRKLTTFLSFAFLVFFYTNLKIKSMVCFLYCVGRRTIQSCFCGGSLSLKQSLLVVNRTCLAG